MIVAVIAVRMVQPSVHQEVDMITMRHGFMSAVPAMLVRAAGLRGAVHRVCRADRDDMLVDMVTVHVVQMAIMQIIDMTVMANRRMPTARAMRVDVIGMVLLGAGGHGSVLLWDASSCQPMAQRLVPWVGSVKIGAVKDYFSEH
jgi:hypothetical protein